MRMSKKTAKIVQVVRVIIPMEASLLDEIDNAWHKRKLRSRAATVRALLQEALAK